MKIIADDKIPFLKGVFEPFIDINYLPGYEINRTHLRDAEVLLVRTRTICNKDLLEGSAVRLIASATIGTDHIDLEYCSLNGIKVTNAPGCNANAVKQWFVASLLFYAQKEQVDLSKKVIGIVGVGHVGKKIAEVCEQLGLYVLLNDPPREEKEGNCIFRGISTIQRECDIITFHTPLTQTGKFKTHHLVDKDFIDRLSPGTLLMNSSRGEVLSTQDLINAVKTGKIAGPILDVWEEEPNISKELLEYCNLVTPHIAGYSIEGKANGTSAVVQASANYLGLPLDNWKTDEDLTPLNNSVVIECSGKSELEILNEAIKVAYSVQVDDQNLRANTDQFEGLRSEYAYRHEPEAYELMLSGASDELTHALKVVGFRIKE